MSAHAIALLAALIAASAISNAAPASYSQLMSEQASSAPSNVVGAPTFDFVDRTLLPTGATVRSAAKTNGGAVWVVTDKGTYGIAGGKAKPLTTPTIFKPLQPQVRPGIRIHQVVNDADGHVWLATSGGLFVTDGDRWWQSLDRRDGMPYENMTCMCLAPNGDVWGGTRQGAWRLRKGKFRYFWGKRWLPSNDVTAISIGTDGRVLIKTGAGSATIEERPMTLVQKAAHYDHITQERHNRHGYICDVGLKVPGDPTKGVILHAADNDGLWTSYYVGAMALRYAVTKDPAARKEAQQSMNAVLDLERLTGIPGFPARAVITDEEIASGNVRGYQKDLKVEFLGASMDQPGGGEPKWFRSPVQKNVWCKGDTSSDEINGHYFAWYMYWTYVADAAEKQMIAATCRRVTDCILKNDYTLVDHTGHKTRWGVWSPQYLNDDPLWAGERGLGSAEILSYLTTAYTITHEQRYLQAKEDLIRKHHYLLNALLYRRSDTGWWGLNHSDDQLAYVTYYPLLMQETNPDRKRLLAEMVARTWEDSFDGQQTIHGEHASFYNFAYGAMTGNPCDPESGIENLRDWPWDLVEWTVHNSQRSDVTLKSHQGGDGRNEREIDRVLPASERPVDRWNTDTWEPDGGSNGAAEQCGSAWLLAYWMGVHHGYIDPKQ